MTGNLTINGIPTQTPNVTTPSNLIITNGHLTITIPMNAGYQAIAFNADSQTFSQYIELSDRNFILNNLRIDIYDTQGNKLLNQYNWGFTLGF